MRVLVTGGNGFLGSSVVAGLAGAGHEVVGADLRFPTSEVDGVRHVLMDVTDAAAVDAGIAEAAPEVVVHLASIVTPGKGSSRAKEYAVDVDGSRHVFDACLAHGVRRVVVSSSGAAYGYHADNPVPLTEDDPVRGNEAFAYSHHKRLVEEQLAALRHEHPELEQVVLRIGTILGRHVDNQITALFERPRLLQIRGADSPFVFIWDSDVVAIIQRAVTGPVTGTFNVAGDGTLTVRRDRRRPGQADPGRPGGGAPDGAGGGQPPAPHAVRPGADEVPAPPPGARQHPAQGDLRLRAVPDQPRGVRGVAGPGRARLSPWFRRGR